LVLEVARREVYSTGYVSSVKQMGLFQKACQDLIRQFLERDENSVKFVFETLIVLPLSADKDKLKLVVETLERTWYRENNGFADNFVQIWRSVRAETWKTSFFKNSWT
jgi:hypothetical protein